jgi:hypothetical protein
MQTLSIHEIKSIELESTQSFDAEKNRAAFSVRALNITDIHGNKITIDLFSHDLKALTINADWNQGQSIVL